MKQSEKKPDDRFLYFTSEDTIDMAQKAFAVYQKRWLQPSGDPLPQWENFSHGFIYALEEACQSSNVKFEQLVQRDQTYEVAFKRMAGNLQEFMNQNKIGTIGEYLEQGLIKEYEKVRIENDQYKKLLSGDPEISFSEFMNLHAETVIQAAKIKQYQYIISTIHKEVSELSAWVVYVKNLPVDAYSTLHKYAGHLKKLLYELTSNANIRFSPYYQDKNLVEQIVDHDYELWSAIDESIMESPLESQIHDFLDALQARGLAVVRVKKPPIEPEPEKKDLAH